MDPGGPYHLPPLIPRAPVLEPPPAPRDPWPALGLALALGILVGLLVIVAVLWLWW